MKVCPCYYFELYLELWPRIIHHPTYSPQCVSGVGRGRAGRGTPSVRARCLVLVTEGLDRAGRIDPISLPLCWRSCWPAAPRHRGDVADGRAHDATVFALKPGSSFWRGNCHVSGQQGRMCTWPALCRRYRGTIVSPLSGCADGRGRPGNGRARQRGRRTRNRGPNECYFRGNGIKMQIMREPRARHGAAWRGQGWWAEQRPGLARRTALRWRRTHPAAAGMRGGLRGLGGSATPRRGNCL